MRIGIVGSRSYSEKNDIIELVNTLAKYDVVVSGGCDGPDTWAEQAANGRGIKTEIYRPTLPPHGSPMFMFTKAYHARNKTIVDNSDVIHAFVSKNRKGGTENTIKHAIAAGKKVIIHSQAPQSSLPGF